MLKSMRIVSLSLALVLLAATGAIAQPGGCFIGDDGFNLGCCTTPQVNLPFFPPVQVGGLWGCFQDCNFQNDYQVNVQLGAPIFVLCDYALIPITVMPAAPGAPGWTGTLFAKYSRTWVELSSTSPVPTPRWRFLVNGDLIPAITAINPNQVPCPYPPSIFGATGAPQPVHVVGHIDYRCQPNSAGGAGFGVRMSLGRLEGCLSHAPWTERPLPPALAGVDRSYYLVAPSNFAWVDSAPPMGPLNGEAVRTSSINLPPVPGASFYTCYGEAQVVQGNLNTVHVDCLCNSGTAAAGARWKHQQLSGVTVCGTSTKTFSSLPVPGTFLPTGLACFTVGRWLPAATGGDPEHLHVYFGVMLYDADCSTNNLPFHIVTGVGTTCYFGALYDPATSGPGMTVSGQFVDLHNCQKLIAGGLAPTFGAPFISTVVWNLNMP